MSRLLDGLLVAIHLILSRDREVMSITSFSFKLSVSATIAAGIIGILLGLIIGYYDFIGKKILVSIINTFTGFPPVVMGVFLYVLLSRSGPLGELSLLYTPQAMFIAQFLLALPIVTSISIQAIHSLPNTFYESLLTLRIQGIREITALLRETRTTLITGIIIAFGRAISEVGAILIVGGNIRWYTRTLTTAAVLEVSKGRPEFAIALGIILLTISLLVNIILQIMQSQYAMTLFSDTIVKIFTNKKKTETPLEKESKPNNISELVNQIYENIIIPPGKSIIFKNLTKNYNGKQVLKSLSAKFENGKIHVIVGPNGVGKTTLLRILSGLEKNYEGEVTLSPSLSQPIYVHQTPYMFKGKTKDNLTIVSKNNSKLELISKLLMIGELLNKPASVLSGGEKRRVAFARALLLKPKVILLDEPTADLDPTAISVFEQILKELRNKGVLIILTTHNILQAKRISDTLTVLIDGKIVATGPLDKILNTKDPEVKAFLTGAMPW